MAPINSSGFPEQKERKKNWKKERKVGFGFCSANWILDLKMCRLKRKPFFHPLLFLLRLKRENTFRNPKSYSTFPFILFLCAVPDLRPVTKFCQKGFFCRTRHFPNEESVIPGFNREARDLLMMTIWEMGAGGGGRGGRLRCRKRTSEANRKGWRWNSQNFAICILLFFFLFCLL